MSASTTRISSRASQINSSLSMSRDTSRLQSNVERNNLSGKLVAHHVSTSKTLENLVVIWYGYLKKFHLVSLSFSSYFNALRNNPQMIRPSYPENELLSFFEMDTLISLGNSVAEELNCKKYHQTQTTLNNMSKININTNGIRLFSFLKNLFEEIRFQIYNLFTKHYKLINSEFEENVVSFKEFLFLSENISYQLDLLNHYYYQTKDEHFRNVASPLPPCLKEVDFETFLSSSNENNRDDFFAKITEIVSDEDEKIVIQSENSRRLTDSNRKKNNMSYRDLIFFAKDAKDARNMELIANIMEEDINLDSSSSISDSDKKHINSILKAPLDSFDVNFRTPY
eukprot:TRINITY_DN2589_c0_g2_i2.p1 TRINITY_DN2589_c0_g2~~TRINITY_DN2589_c0_g2_i2.p1  ORF type:complete len:340 (+),score=91.75 TRINITY_DN2589_c0_g2_i2:56-1075(+)